MYKYNPFEEILQRLDSIESLLNDKEPVSVKRKNEIIDRKELCKRLAITEPTVIRYEKKGKIPFMQIGTSIRYNWESVVEALEERKEKPRPITMRYVKLTQSDPFPKRSFVTGTGNFIYIMRNKVNGRYKIGISQDPLFREKTLMSAEPEIELLHKWEGEPKDEKLIHEKFSNYRIRGEWFSLNEFQLNEIISYMSCEEFELQN